MPQLLQHEVVATPNEASPPPNAGDRVSPLVLFIAGPMPLRLASAVRTLARRDVRWIASGAGQHRADREADRGMPAQEHLISTNSTTPATAIVVLAVG